jgi:hypothetical protein
MKDSLISKLRWTKIGTPQPIPTAAFALPPEPQPTTSTALALDLYGLPEVPAAQRTTIRTETRFLLKVASEIEHGLLVQYLYAAYSINASLPTANEWRGTIRNIAIQEMDHLITVQNMLLALKNDQFQTYFDRESFPVAPDHVGFYPYAFRLEPFSGDSLSKYVAAESPLPETVCDATLRSTLEQIIARAEKVTGMKTIGHVGNLYAYLYWLFLPSDDFQGPWLNFPASWFRRRLPGHHLSPADFADPAELARCQARPDPDEFRANDGNAANYPNNDDGSHRWVFRVTSATDALRAIAQIATQGEGTEMAMDSHFLEFLGVYQVVDKLPSGTAAHTNVPTNPNLRQDPETAEGRILNVSTRVWAQLCNTRYLMLLQMLPLALAQRRDRPSELARRKALIGATIDTEMKVGIRYLATRLINTLPRSADPAQFAGPPFELPDERLPDTTAEQWKELVHLIGVSADLMAKIQTLTGPAAPTTQDNPRLKALQDSDQALLQLVPPEYRPSPSKENPPVAVPKLNTFADVQAFMNQFVADHGTDLSGSPHADFWSKDYHSFVNGDVPGVLGVKILVKGDAEHSNLILILRGPLAVGNKRFSRMPADGSGFMTDEQIAALAAWINADCPQ